MIVQGPKLKDLSAIDTLLYLQFTGSFLGTPLWQNFHSVKNFVELQLN